LARLAISKSELLEFLEVCNIVELKKGITGEVTGVVNSGSVVVSDTTSGKE